MSLSKVDQSISVIRFLIKKKRRRIDEISKKVAPTESEKIFIGQELEMIQNTETLIEAFTKEINKNLGRIPPSDGELEETVLGAVVLEGDALARIKDFLLVDHFYLQSSKLIYGAVLKLQKAGNPIDMRTVVSTLRHDGHLEAVGGALKIAEITSKVVSSGHLEYHARILVEMALKRELITVGSKLISDGYDENADCFDMLDYATKTIKQITAWIK